MSVDATTEASVAKLKILADATRFSVVRRLMIGPQYPGDLGTALAVEQSLLSHHLRILRDAELVVTQREGKSVRYALAPAVAGGVDQPTALYLGCCRIQFS